MCNKMQHNQFTSTAAYLSQSALDLSEEVIIWDLWCRIVHVIDSKQQPLNLFKVIVNLKCMRELRAQWVLDILSSTYLHVRETYMHKTVSFFTTCVHIQSSIYHSNPFIMYCCNCYNSQLLSNRPTRRESYLIYIFLFCQCYKSARRKNT